MFATAPTRIPSISASRVRTLENLERLVKDARALAPQTQVRVSWGRWKVKLAPGRRATAGARAHIQAARDRNVELLQAALAARGCKLPPKTLLDALPKPETLTLGQLQAELDALKLLDRAIDEGGLKPDAALKLTAALMADGENHDRVVDLAKVLRKSDTLDLASALRVLERQAGRTAAGDSKTGGPAAAPGHVSASASSTAPVFLHATDDAPDGRS